MLPTSDSPQPAQFRNHVVAWLRQHEPSAGLPLQQDTLERMVDAGIARAHRAGIADPSAVAGFVAIMFALSPNFDEHPTLRGLLQDTSLTERQRVERIAAAPRELRIEAAGQSRLSAWFE